jgi:Rrf2 family transcriptional regulator, iron-sulfur cluster assembly transcription factor
MTFSKTTEYALRILTLMVVEEKEKYSSDYIHKQLKIPKKYLQRLLTILSKSGLIKSERGKYGGYKFAKKADKIYLSDIIKAVEGFQTTPTCFFGFGECVLENPCAMHDIWADSQMNLIKVLSSTKLTDLKKKMK